MTNDNMNILLTNDDGYTAPGIHAAYDALRSLGTVHVIAPRTEQSACAHKITLRNVIPVESTSYGPFGPCHVVDGTPADCVRLAVGDVFDTPIDLVVAGINRGANAGVDTFYSGTIAAAREGAILGYRSIALSNGVVEGVEIDWKATSKAAGEVVKMLLDEELPGPGFFSVNFPLPLPKRPMKSIHRVPVAMNPFPVTVDKTQRDGLVDYRYISPYWSRPVDPDTDFGALMRGGISITQIPLVGRF